MAARRKAANAWTVSTVTFRHLITGARASRIMPQNHTWSVVAAGIASGLLIFWALRPDSCAPPVTAEPRDAVEQQPVGVARSLPSNAERSVVIDRKGVQSIPGSPVRVSEYLGIGLPRFSLHLSDGDGGVREVVTDEFGRAFVDGPIGKTYSVRSSSPDWVMASVDGRPASMVIGQDQSHELSLKAVRVLACGLAFIGGTPTNSRFIWDRKSKQVSKSGLDGIEFKRIQNDLREEHGIHTRLLAPWPQAVRTGRIELLFKDKGRHQFPLIMQPPSLYKPYVVDVNALPLDRATLPGEVLVKVQSRSGESVNIGLVSLKTIQSSDFRDTPFKNISVLSGVVTTVPPGEYSVQLGPSQGSLLNLNGVRQCSVAAGARTDVILECSDDVREVQLSTPRDGKFSLYRLSVPADAGSWRWGPVRPLAGPASKMLLPVGNARVAFYSDDPDTARLALFDVVPGVKVQECDSDDLLADSTPSSIKKPPGKWR